VSLVVVEVTKSTMVHSVVEDGTWKRLQRGNREMTAKEVNEQIDTDKKPHQDNFQHFQVTIF
jgi:hypothetical protein